MFIKKRFFYLSFIIASISVVGVKVPLFYMLAMICAGLLVLALLVDVLMLLYVKMEGERTIAQKLDLGEKNPVRLAIRVTRGMISSCYSIDEIPADLRCSTDEQPMIKTEDGELECLYTLFPTRRGAYKLGRMLVFASFLGLVERRFIVEKKGREVDVYPAFSRLREKEQQARTMTVENMGIHRRQMPSNQTEFQDIREYVIGDDIRTVNWKATARAGRTMVNNYEDERSQNVYNIIDCGRVMHRTFDGLTLQDYAINASLLVSYSAISTENDNVGLFTYGPKGTDYLPSRCSQLQLKNIMKRLYALETEYGEGDLEELCLIVDRQVQRRSLMILHTDYTTLAALERELPLLRRLSQRHCLVVVMFLDKEIENVSERKNKAKSVNNSQITAEITNINDEKGGKIKLFDLVEGSLASDLVQQKLAISDKLQQLGIHCVLTYPENMSFSVVRKYAELKAKRAW